MGMANSVITLGFLIRVLLIDSTVAAHRPTFQALAMDDRFVCRPNATGNGEEYDTIPIQSSIDRCAERGGGVVHIPPGVYLTGTLYLRSNVTLWVDEGATIVGSARQQDFPRVRTRWYTILAEDVENVELTGGGVVTGQGWRFVREWKREKNVMVSWNVSGDCGGDECRPRLVGFVNCRNVRVWNVVLEDPAYWCLHVVNSDIVSIHDVSIHGNFNSPNTDGIDIDSSNNTIIKNCHIDTGDDAICPKTQVGPLYNLTVSNCWIRTKSCAVKLGSQTFYDLANLHFEQLVIVDSHRGLGIQLRDQGNVNNVTFANIHMSTRYYHPSWWGFAEPIYVTACPRTPATTVGSVNNVHFINITTMSENGIFLSGSEESFLKGLEFRNVSVTLARWTNFSAGYHDYRPGCEGLVVHRMAGLFMEFVQDVWMQKVVLLWKGSGPKSGVGGGFGGGGFGGAAFDWGLPFYITPATVKDMRLVDYENAFIT